MLLIVYLVYNKLISVEICICRCTFNIKSIKFVVNYAIIIYVIYAYMLILLAFVKMVLHINFILPSLRPLL